MSTLRINKSEVKPPILSKVKVKNTVEIINLTIHKEKLTALLNDGRELSIPLE